MRDTSKTLVLIMARGGSKGIPRKNIKPLAGRPLLHYSIDIARQFTSDDNICVSTDDLEIIKKVEEYGLKVPFTRPAELATDEAGSYEVELHAIAYYEKLGRHYETLVILQPTSPFRKIQHLNEAFQLFSSNIDMVTTVKEANANPYFNLFEEDEHGYLVQSKPNDFKRRQDSPPVYQYNGAIYVVNISSLKEAPEYKFKKVKKLVMDDLSSVDLDKPIDWMWAEFLLEHKQV